MEALPGFHQIIRDELMRIGGGQMPQQSDEERMRTIGLIQNAHGRFTGSEGQARARAALDAMSPTGASAAPTPTARPAQSPVQRAIEEQITGSVPVPTPRPDVTTPPATAGQDNGLVGDAGVMEAILGAYGGGFPPPPATTGDMVVAENVARNPYQPAQGAVPPAAVTPEAPVAPDATQPADQQSSNAGGALIGAVVALGGIGAAKAMYDRFIAGDADAARTFQALGVNPEDFSMFAEEPLAQSAGRVQPSTVDAAPAAPTVKANPGGNALPPVEPRRHGAQTAVPPGGKMMQEWYNSLNAPVQAAPEKPKPKVAPGRGTRPKPKVK